MKKIFYLAISCSLLFACTEKSVVDIYTTTADKTKTMQKDSVMLMAKSDVESTDNIITLHPEEKYQEMDGFGAAITGSSCYNLLKMAPADRTAILKETFDPKDGYGYSYIRISLGASDFSLDEYTYCDKPGLENFAINEYDKRDLFPILKEIKAINPEVKIMASPWSCPKWMKVNNLKELKPFDSWTSGQLNPKYYQDYAAYFVKYIQAMEKEGFKIDATTIQNEPLNRGNSMSLYMTWQEQRDFVRDALGPAFEKAAIKTKIVVYDHNYNYDNDKSENYDQGQYPVKIYEDANAAKYIDGAAYHAYGGEKEELLTVHNAYPDKNLYFTEMSIGLWGEGYSFAKDLMWNMREVCIGSINNFNKAVIMWNYMLDDNHGPDRPGGCDICLGCITIDSNDYKTMDKNSHYYTMAHLSKVIKPRSFRIKSEGKTDEKIYYSAFENPDKSYSVVLLNENQEQKTVTVALRDKAFSYIVPAQSVISCIWK